MLWTLTYVSRAMVERHSVDIIAIARASMRNNAALGLTGALYYDDNQFYQVLEGEKDAVRAMFDIIRADNRHCDVVVLQETMIDKRRFPEWSMKFIDGGWVPRSRQNFAYDTLRAAQPDIVQSRTQELRSY